MAKESLRLDRSAVKSWALSISQALIGAYFFVAGFLKVVGARPMVEAFARWQWPGSARVLWGVLEIAASVALVVPRTARYGAAAVASIVAVGMYIRVAKLELFPGLLEPLLLLPLLVVLSRGLAYQREVDGETDAGAPRRARRARGDDDHHVVRVAATSVRRPMPPRPEDI